MNNLKKHQDQMEQDIAVQRNYRMNRENIQYMNRSRIYDSNIEDQDMVLVDNITKNDENNEEYYEY